MAQTWQFFRVLLHDSPEAVKYIIDWFKPSVSYDVSTITSSEENDFKITFKFKVVGQPWLIKDGYYLKDNYLAIGREKVTTTLTLRDFPTVLKYNGLTEISGKQYLSFTPEIIPSGGRKRKYKTRRTRRMHNKTVVVKRTARRKRK